MSVKLLFSYSQSAMMEVLSISRKRVQLALEKLIADGKIERIGSDRSSSLKTCITEVFEEKLFKALLETYLSL